MVLPELKAVGVCCFGPEQGLNQAKVLAAT